MIVSGIGHKIKSVNNPDLRVELVKEYVIKHFPSHSLLDYALAVEKVTTAKKDTVRLSTVMFVFRSGYEWDFSYDSSSSTSMDVSPFHLLIYYETAVRSLVK